MSDSLADALPREMTRVRDEVLANFISMRGRPHVMVEPQIEIIQRELDDALKAIIRGDVMGMLRAYSSLKEFQS